MRKFLFIASALFVFYFLMDIKRMRGNDYGKGDIIFGCTDSEADNYNPDATEDDGSCIYSGCTDEEAVNYDPQANEDDGSCVYIEISMEVSAYSGCAPFTVTVYNQTFIEEGSTCTFEVNEEIIQTECVSSFSYTFDEAGTYELKYIYQLNEIVSDSTLTIVVYPLPSVPVIVYDASNFEVQCSNCDNYTIQWSYQDEIIPDSSESALSILHEEVYRNGYYAATVTENEHGCISSSEALFVLQPYFAVDSTEGCAPHSIEITNLTDEVEDIQYTIDFGDGDTDDEFPATIQHTYSGADIYSITVTAIAPQGEGVYTRTVQVYPVVEPVLVHVPDDGLVVCENCNLFQSAVWNVDGIIFNDFGPHSDGAENYTVTGTTEHGCTGFSTLILTPGAIEKMDKNIFVLYPNPANDFVIIGQEGFSPYQIGAYDFTGKMIYQNSIFHNRHEVDTRQWQSGIYLLRLANADEIASFRLAVAH